MTYSGQWHGGVRLSAASYGFDGPDLAGWHNPVDHTDHLSYLEVNDPLPYRISEHIRGPSGDGTTAKQQRSEGRARMTRRSGQWFVHVERKSVVRTSWSRPVASGGQRLALVGHRPANDCGDACPSARSERLVGAEKQVVSLAARPRFGTQLDGEARVAEGEVAKR